MATASLADRISGAAGGAAKTVGMPTRRGHSISDDSPSDDSISDDSISHCHLGAVTTVGMPTRRVRREGG